MFLSDQACLLNKSATGEKTLLLSFFLREHGLQQTIHKERSHASQQLLPDLFQIGELTLRKKGPDSPGFLSEFTLVESFNGIGRTYAHLTAASLTCRFFERNLLHLESFESAWELLLQGLRAYAERPFPQATLFKTVYRFSREEGYPVTSSWLQGLSTANRIEVERILKEPLDRLTLSEECVLHWLECLSFWIEADTALYPPDWKALRRRQL